MASHAAHTWPYDPQVSDTITKIQLTSTNAVLRWPSAHIFCGLFCTSKSLHLLDFFSLSLTLFIRSICVQMDEVLPGTRLTGADKGQVGGDMGKSKEKDLAGSADTHSKTVFIEGMRMLRKIQGLQGPFSRHTSVSKHMFWLACSYY